MIAAGVVLLHAAALWALQSGRVALPSAVVVPVTIVNEEVVPPAPAANPAPLAPEPKRPAPPARKPLPPKPQPARTPMPQPAAVPAQAEAPLTAAPAPTPEAPALPIAGAPGSGPAAPAAPAGPPSTGAGVELPSSGAGYLQNPAPVYPAISKRLGEQGKVLVRVLIGADGIPQKAELKRSSGFDRLDRSALDYVMKCRYLPGKLGGVPQAMWYEAPVVFVLQ